jgi:two-component system response regulator AtoC
MKIMPADLVQCFRIDAAELPCEAVLFGNSAAMREIRGQVERILQNDLPVLIRGESGTGKETTAKFLHAYSHRRHLPFVKVNCAEIPESVLESDLMGYEKGGAGGASAARRGLVELAAGGTLFLDEIGGMGWALQTRLLDLLHEGQYSAPVGFADRKERVRVICATNSDLEKAVERRAFRQDLFYRIEVINLRLAPLRERKGDLPLLCEHFREKFGKQFGRVAPPLTPGALRQLERREWPGNLRELENWMARTIILGDDLPQSAKIDRREMPASSDRPRRPRNGHLKAASRQAAVSATRAAILRALQANRWNRRKTAVELNMSYRSLLHKLREAGVPQRRKGHKRPPPKP